MQAQARPNSHLLTLRAMRRDLALLAAATAVSVGVSAWLHGQTCVLERAPAISVAPALEAKTVPQAPAAQPVTNTGAPMVYGEHFAFVIDLEEPYLVLATDVDASWEGEFEGLLGVDTVFRSVDQPALPPALAAMEGRAFALWGTSDDGTPTSLGKAILGAPRLVSQASGMLGPDGQLDTWSLLERLEQDGALPADLQARARAAIWAEGARLLVAPLRGVRASEASWARAAELPAPEFFEEVPLDPEAVAAQRTAFVTSQEGLNAVREHERLGHGSLVPYLRSVGWSDGQRRVRLATTFVDSPHVEICGGFDWAYAVGAHHAVSGWDVPVEIPTSHTIGPALVGDFNADGYADLLLEPRPLDGDTTMMRGGPDGFVEVQTLVEVPYFGCRC